jgi:hypothetical protein
MKPVKLLFLLAAVFVLQACSNAYYLDSAQRSLRGTFAARNYDRSVTLLDDLSEDDVYRSKDAVLYNLEKATALHFNEEFDASNKYYSQAEQRIDELFTKSISRGIQSFVTSDNALAYDGEDYEDIYLNIFKSLNYLHQNDLEGALVEARRVSHKLQQLNIKYKGLADALSKADTTGQAEWKPGKTNVQNSALGRYLSAILYAKTGHQDDARIAFEGMIEAFKDQPALYPGKVNPENNMNIITQPEKYNVLVTSFSGRAPIKRQEDVRLYLHDPDLYLKFSLPSLHRYRSQVKSIKISVNDSLLVPLTPIEDMDLVAQEVYKVKEPIIYARAFVRAFLKAIGSRTISNKAEERSRFLGGLTKLLGIVGQEVTEKADLRGWQTMPGRAYATVFKLPPGTHRFSINYYSPKGKLIFTEKKTKQLKPNDPLTLIESLYWN